MPGEIKFPVRISDSVTFGQGGDFIFEEAGEPVRFVGRETIEFEEVIQEAAEPKRFRCRFGKNEIILSEVDVGDGEVNLVLGFQRIDGGRGTAVWVAEEGGTIDEDD